MLDRMALSVRNQWIDDKDRVYIIFTLEQVMECMNCGKDKEGDPLAWTAHMNILMVMAEESVIEKLIYN